MMRSLIPHIPNMVRPESQATPGRLVLYVGITNAASTDLFQQLTLFGYNAVVVDSPDLLAAIRNTQDDIAALVVYLGFTPDDLMAMTMVQEIRERISPLLPVIMLAERDDMEARLTAVRLGGQAYLSPPFDAVALVEQLDALTGRLLNPYRIVIVDDSSIIASIYAAVLEEANLLVKVVLDPMQLMQSMFDFQPDLILMDMYMPSCTGHELATVVRQQPAFVSTPIVFLSVEDDREKQLSAMLQGGDDFLTKPVNTEYLVSLVISRVQRARSMRDRMIRDGLTGVLNHSSIKAQLDIEIRRAARDKQPLTLAMLDLDHFKQINDTYGHAAGDQVLLTLARLLQQRLRQTDVIGRYGGEEFIILLPHTGLESARMLMDEFRVRFSQIPFALNGNEWSVTFSCGVASYPTQASASSLLASADNALYQAKRQGRNQICTTG